MNKKLVSNTYWAVIGQIGYILVGFIGVIILGRLLSPSDFGLVGIAMFFVGLFNVLVESGFGGALIRKKNTTNVDYSTIFIFNLGVSVFLCVLLIGASSFIADFYNQKSLSSVLIALSSILIINAFTITQNAKLVKDLKFKKRGLYKFISLSLAVIVSIFIAYYDGSYWAIVWMQILSSLFFLIILLIFEGKIDKLIFSRKSFSEMSSFGLFTTLSSTLNAIFDNIYQLILGKYFSLSNVGFYYQAKRLQEAPDTVYKLVILQVFYAFLSKYQDNIDLFKINYNKIVKYCSAVLGLSTSLVYLYAEDIIYIVLGEKWIDSTFYLKILVLASFFTLQEMMNRNIFKIFDKTHQIFYLEILKKIFQSISIIIGVIYGDIYILLYGLIVTSILSFFINFYFSRKIIDDISRDEILNFLKIVFSCVFCSLCLIFIFEFYEIQGLYKLLFTPIFIFFYVLLLKLTNIISINEIYKFKSLIKK